MLPDKCDARFFGGSSKNVACVILEKVKTIFSFFLDIHYKWLMKCIFVENGCILGKLMKGAKFLFMLMALFGHQPTYKNLRENTGRDQNKIFLCWYITEL